MSPGIEQLIRDYLTRLSGAARGRLDPVDRRALIHRTRDFIERKASLVQPQTIMDFARLVSELGEPTDLVDQEVRKLAALRGDTPPARTSARIARVLRHDNDGSGRHWSLHRTTNGDNENNGVNGNTDGTDGDGTARPHHRGEDSKPRRLVGLVNLIPLQPNPQDHAARLLGRSRSAAPPPPATATEDQSADAEDTASEDSASTSTESAFTAAADAAEKATADSASTGTESAISTVSAAGPAIRETTNSDSATGPTSAVTQAGGETQADVPSATDTSPNGHVPTNERLTGLASGAALIQTPPGGPPQHGPSRTAPSEPALLPSGTDTQPGEPLVSTSAGAPSSLPPPMDAPPNDQAPNAAPIEARPKRGAASPWVGLLSADAPSFAGAGAVPGLPESSGRDAPSGAASSSTARWAAVAAAVGGARLATVRATAKLTTSTFKWCQRRPLEATASMFLGIGGAIYPPVWLLGAALALGSKLWDYRDKWLGLGAPLLLTVVGPAVAVSVLAGKYTLGHDVHLGWVYADVLSRVSAFLGASYLVWRSVHGRRPPTVPPWNKPRRVA
jgi:hypothetical protein